MPGGGGGMVGRVCVLDVGARSEELLRGNTGDVVETAALGVGCRERPARRQATRRGEQGDQEQGTETSVLHDAAARKRRVSALTPSAIADCAGRRAP